MVVQHNIPAINSHRNLLVNNSATAKNLEKLSSGYRINRAGDDAAGLAISEKMRGQIRGLAMAEQNTSNAISLIQTAEGGLNETHAILQRMRELAVQASNGTYDDTVDRANLDLEVERLKSEINRIAASTNYNGIGLLDGTCGGVKGDHASVAAMLATGTGVGLGAGNTIASATLTGDAYIIVRDDGTSVLQHNNETYEIDSTGQFFQDTSGATPVTVATLGTAYTIATTNKSGVIKVQLGAAAKALAHADHTVATEDSQVTFQIGANGTADQQVGLGMTNMSAGNIGNGTSYISRITIGTQTAANDAIAVITGATNQVSRQRAELGAMQNRLEHTLNNLGVTKENLTAAESVIRDVDMAKEMMEFTKNNILVQASQAMLAQANMLPQGILSLLR